MSVRFTLWWLLLATVVGPTKASGTIEAPPPPPDKALYARVPAIPEMELASVQAIILGLRQGALPTHTDLFSRYGGTAALADMLLFDRTLQADYAEMIAASDGKTVLQQNFREDSLNRYQRLVEAEPSGGLDAVLKYVFHDYVVRGSDVAIIRLIELGPAAIARFLEMHRSGMLAGETHTDLSLCGQPAAREYEALVVVLSFAGHPALSDVWAEPSARDAWLYGVQTLNRVSLAVFGNLAYRMGMP